MNKIEDIDEAKLFVQNLTNIIERLHLSKAKLNSKLKWPTNKLRNILGYNQAPLIDDAKSVRKLLGLQIADLLTKILDNAEIDDLSERLADVKLTKNTDTSVGSPKHNPVSYITVLLYRKYTLEDEFTKKDIIKSIPAEFANYSIEWNKNRLRKYVKKVKEVTNSENKSEHVFKLTQDIPSGIAGKAISEVGEDWLE
ncbi:hypothetical protein SAMN05421747_103207 [Parapedobacter composti]|uniref:Uncharacterized protein n=1 Tax=Parapedobacter composti TaxID=623281 RepID=A0A1I1FWF5_9SPHI|nr:hypothetical protein [Parapedobacter composti]SFC03787.1 hypothetical protein SAMN05421747_103207 [Parapedobacter composti]